MLKLLTSVSLRYFAKRCLHSISDKIKVTIIGGAGEVGRHLGVYVKVNNDVDEIALYDIVNCEGVSRDLMDINTKPVIKCYKGEKELLPALQSSNLVLIVGGQTRSPKVKTRNEYFEINAPIIKKIIEAVPQVNSKLPFIHICTNPVNALVPLAAEVLTKQNHYDKRLLSGSTSIDTMRARAMLGLLKHIDPTKLDIPVIGGHSAESVTPILSQCKPKILIYDIEREILTNAIQNASVKLSEIKDNQGESVFSMAYAAAMFSNNVIRAIRGRTIEEVAYIPCDVAKGVRFFSTRFLMDKNGIKDIYPLPLMDEFETNLFNSAVKDIEGNIKLAQHFLNT